MPYYFIPYFNTPICKQTNFFTAPTKDKIPIILISFRSPLSHSLLIHRILGWRTGPPSWHTYHFKFSLKNCSILSKGIISTLSYKST